MVQFPVNKASYNHHGLESNVKLFSHIRAYFFKEVPYRLNLYNIHHHLQRKSILFLSSWVSLYPLRYHCILWDIVSSSRISLCPKWYHYVFWGSLILKILPTNIFDSCRIPKKLNIMTLCEIQIYRNNWYDRLKVKLNKKN